MDIESSYNFKKINSRTSSSGVVGFKRLSLLASEGYEVVVNLLPDDSEHAVEGEKEIVESQGVEYIYIPVDFENPMTSEVNCFIGELEKIGDKKLHIHCAANYRVSAFYSCYAVAKGIWSSNQAIDFISSIWNPREFPVWFELLQNHEIKLGPE